MATPNAVVAKLHNQASYEEGEADAALDPGQGCVLYEDANGDKFVRAAAADEQTTRVVREARNPPRGQGVEDESPLAQAYDAGEHVETIGFGDHDQARVRLGGNASADPVDNLAAWDANGELTDEAGTVDGTNAPTEFVGRIRKDLSAEFDTFDMVVVEFF